MYLIPVIDLRHRQVVHAIGGNRAHYQPINRFSQLTRSNELAAVVECFYRAFACRQCYIADLDAILGDGEHSAEILQAAQQFPDVEFWLDNGRSHTAAYQSEQQNLRFIVGSESQIGPACTLDAEAILSLDYVHGTPRGPISWFEQSQYWPKTVIAMTLKQVGSQAGPDWATLKQLMSQQPAKHWVAAGGIRNCDDLQQLQAQGVYAALVATALHNGSIRPGAWPLQA
jgi:phosphoribosylformimino-5-aminoimidazole carboxamide ribotide isomerase